MRFCNHWRADDAKLAAMRNNPDTNPRPAEQSVETSGGKLPKAAATPKGADELALIVDGRNFNEWMATCG